VAAVSPAGLVAFIPTTTVAVVERFQAAVPLALTGITPTPTNTGGLSPAALLAAVTLLPAAAAVAAAVADPFAERVGDGDGDGEGEGEGEGEREGEGEGLGEGLGGGDNTAGG